MVYFDIDNRRSQTLQLTTNELPLTYGETVTFVINKTLNQFAI